MSQARKCVVCGKPITWRFWICEKHRKEYGDNLRDWPEWLQFLVKDISRERYSDERQQRLLDMLDDLGPKHLISVDPHDEDRF